MRRFTVLLLVVTACAYRTASVATPEPLRVTHLAVTGTNEADTRTAYDRTRRMLHSSTHAQASASVAVNLGETKSYLSFLRADGMDVMLFLIWPIMSGMVVEREHVGVDVVVTSHGRLLRGHGEGEKDGSIYAPAQKRALAVALGRALRDAYAH